MPSGCNPVADRLQQSERVGCVMHDIERRDHVVLAGKPFRDVALLKANTAADAGFARVRGRALHGGAEVVVADVARAGERARELDQRPAPAATDVRDVGAALEVSLDVRHRGQPDGQQKILEPAGREAFEAVPHPGRVAALRHTAAVLNAATTSSSTPTSAGSCCNMPPTNIGPPSSASGPRARAVARSARWRRRRPGSSPRQGRPATRGGSAR